MRNQELVDTIYALLLKNGFMNMRQLVKATGANAGRIRSAYDQIPELAENDKGFVFLTNNYNPEAEKKLLKNRHCKKEN